MGRHPQEVAIPTSSTAPRYLFEPLLDFIRNREASRTGVPVEEIVDNDLADVLGIDRRRFWGLCAPGSTLSTLMADRFAVRAGTHPALLWPTWFDDAKTEPHCLWCKKALVFGNHFSICCQRPKCAKAKAAQEMRDYRRRKLALRLGAA